MFGTRGLHLYIIGFLATLVFGCGSSGGGTSLNTAGLTGTLGTPLGNGAVGGPSQPGPGTGAPAPFVPGGDPGPGPTPTPTPTPPPATPGLYVRAGATGNGTADNPRGDLAEALEEAQAGQTVTILYSADPLTVVGRPAIADGVALVGQANSDGALPVVVGVFSVGSGTTVSGFRSEPGGQRYNFDLSDSRDVTLTGMHIVNGAQKLLFNNVSGEIRLLNSTVEGGGSGGGSLAGNLESGSANFTISNCDLLGATLSLSVWGTGTHANVFYNGNRSSGGISLRCDGTDSKLNTTVENNDFTAEFGGNYIQVDHTNGGSGDLTCVGNSMTATGTIWLRRFDSGGGGGTITVRDNLWQDFAGLPYLFRFDDGAYDLTVVNNEILRNSATNQNTDMQINAAGSSRIRARVQDNTFSYGLYLSASGSATVDVGVYDNMVGQNPSGAGPGRRALSVVTGSDFTGILSAAITGNSVGTPEVPSSLTVLQSSGTFHLERLSTLNSDNTLFGTVTATVTGTVVPIPDNTIDIPPLP